MPVAARCGLRGDLAPLTPTLSRRERELIVGALEAARGQSLLCELIVGALEATRGQSLLCELIVGALEAARGQSPLPPGEG